MVCFSPLDVGVDLREWAEPCPSVCGQGGVSQTAEGQEWIEEVDKPAELPPPQ